MLVLATTENYCRVANPKVAGRLAPRYQSLLAAAIRMLSTLALSGACLLPQAKSIYRRFLSDLDSSLHRRLGRRKESLGSRPTSSFHEPLHPPCLLRTLRGNTGHYADERAFGIEGTTDNGPSNVASDRLCKMERYMPCNTCPSMFRFVVKYRSVEADAGISRGQPFRHRPSI